MTRRPLHRIAALTLLIGTAPAGAQSALRPSPSGRATAELTLSLPRATEAAMPASATGMTSGASPMPSPGASAPARGTSPAATADSGAARKRLVLRLDYGQPHLRGRTLHGDSLVPWDRPWRLGANGNTTLTSDVDLLLGGTPLPAGTYVLYAIPSRTTWTLVVQRSVGQSAMQYADSNDVARIDLRHTALAAPLESLTMWLIPSLQPGPARGELRFAWGTDQLSTDWAVR